MNWPFWYCCVTMGSETVTRAAGQSVFASITSLQWAFKAIESNAGNHMSA
jgi:hypothetical protein